jgi:catechol 2,3-dioxygenase-like lactoylglutathione lyase family enzyme
MQMPQPDFRLTQIGVIMLGVQDLARSLGFYRDKLGLTVQSEIPGFAFMDAGKVTLCLSEPAARARGQVAGAGEIVFSVDDVTMAYQALREKGVQFTHEPRAVSPGTWVANLDDPDGNHLSLYGPQSKGH